MITDVELSDIANRYCSECHKRHDCEWLPRGYCTRLSIILVELLRGE